MDKPFLLLDIDGVCLNWEKGLMNFVQSHRPHLHHPSRIDDTAFYLSEKMGVTAEVANILVWDFHCDASFAQLEPLPGADQAIAVLRDTYRLVAITACGSDEQIAQGRQKNLDTVFDHAFERLICVDTSSQKRQYLLEYPPSYWVEDRMDNAIMGLECGHRSWLINAPHNLEDIDHPGITRINCLSDLVSLII